MLGKATAYRYSTKGIISSKAFKRVIKAFFCFIFSFLLVFTQMPFAFHLQLLVKAYAYGNTYYVAGGGSDSNPGTETQPWRTIQKAANTVQAGDTVYIKQGIYREAVTLARQGSSGSLITYEAYGSDEVIISGAEDKKGTSNWIQDSGSIYYTTSINWTPQQVFQDGERLSQKNTKAEVVQGSWYFEDSTDKIYIWANGGSNPGIYQIDISKRGFCFEASGSYTVLKKLTMEYANDSTSSDDRNANLTIQAPYVTVDNCKFRKARLNNIFIGDSQATNVTIKNCPEINYAGKIGIFVHSAANFNISNNVINHNGNYSWYDGGVGIEIMADDYLGTIDGGIIDGNETAYNGWGNYLSSGNGIEIYGINNEVKNITVTNNHSHHNVNYGIDLATNARYCNVEHNVCYDNGQSPESFGRQINAYGNSYGNRIAFNLLYNFGTGANGAGIQLWDYCDGNEVYNNTFINKVAGTQMCIQVGATSRNCKVKNNVFIMDNTDGMVMKVWGDSQQGFESDYNDLILRSGNCLVEWGGTKYYNLQSWQGSGQDAHSKSVDPQFANEQALDFNLKSTSPCIDQGVNLGYLYSGSAPDIGAYEYQGAIPPQVTSASPSNLASGISINTTVRAIFDKDMDSSTINSNTFTLYVGSTKVSGSVSYDSPTRTATLDPMANLQPSSTYTATLTTGVKDASGSSLATNYSWTFTTYTPLGITSTNPVNLASGISINTTVKATFDKDMDSSTINSNTFTLYVGSTKVNGSISYDSSTRTAVFNPSTNLQPSSTYIATLTTGVKDISESSLATNYSWTFTTHSSRRGKILVKFKGGATKDEVNSICSSVNTLVVNLFWIGNNAVYVLEVQDASSPDNRVLQLKTMPQVEYAELNGTCGGTLNRMVQGGIGEGIVSLETIPQVNGGELIPSLVSIQNAEQLDSLIGAIQLNPYNQKGELNQTTPERPAGTNSSKKKSLGHEYEEEEKHFAEDDHSDQSSLGKIWHRVRAWYDIVFREVRQTFKLVVELLL